MPGTEPRPLPGPIRAYVRAVERVNRAVGRAVMYVVFGLIGLLLFSSFDRLVLGANPLWVVEMAEFLMTGYYFLAGAYSLQLDGHVRMDLLYSRLPSRRQALLDVLTASVVLFYLVMLLLGGIESTRYAIETEQTNFSAWGPPLAPIKAVMTVGIALMLLQAIALFFRDLARLSGRSLA